MIPTNTPREKGKAQGTLDRVSYPERFAFYLLFWLRFRRLLASGLTPLGLSFWLGFTWGLYFCANTRYLARIEQRYDAAQLEKFRDAATKEECAAFCIKQKWGTENTRKWLLEVMEPPSARFVGQGPVRGLIRGLRRFRRRGEPAPGRIPGRGDRPPRDGAAGLRRQLLHPGFLDAVERQGRGCPLRGTVFAIAYAENLPESPLVLEGLLADGPEAAVRIFLNGTAAEARPLKVGPDGSATVRDPNANPNPGAP